MLSNSMPSEEKEETAKMAKEPAVPQAQEQSNDWNASDQSLLDATLAATPTQRIAWLEEALRLAYATGALKPRRMISKEEWDVMGSLPK